MKFWQSILIATVTWPLFGALGLVLYILGALTVPLALWRKAYSLQTTPFGQKQLFDWPIMKPYNNLEDGLYPPEYALRFPTWSHFRLAFTWCCLRNPVPGLRFMPYISIIPNRGVQHWPVQNPTAAEAKEPNFWYAWLGYHSCVWWQFYVGSTLYRFWIGSAKLYPLDAHVLTYGYRQHGTGPFVQLKRVQTGENRN